ncbi:uncharacterized protein [Coffea arabica]|uniref:Reverse transcriptase zinc-binding domain-containing protein n=1 Tax=Coffea arabica TaxID=13443 RepID=A0ABM4W8P3_COFAR
MDEGGLGFKSLSDQVDAFNMKLWWWLQERNTFWAELMFEKYIGRGHLMEVNENYGSHTWRRMCSIRHAADQQMFWQLGREVMDFWRDRWALHALLINLSIMEDPPQLRVWELWQRDAWNLRVQPSQHDVVVWNASPSGIFSSQCAYELVPKRKSSSLIHSIIWNPMLPIKYFFLAWRVLYGFLPLDTLLQQRGMLLASKCEFCEEEESARHLFFAGGIAVQPRKLWGLVIWWKAPSEGRYKLNIDASVKNGRASGGGAIRDHQGRVVVAFVNELGSMGVLEDKAAALQSGLQICISRHL